MSLSCQISIKSAKVLVIHEKPLMIFCILGFGTEKYQGKLKSDDKICCKYFLLNFCRCVKHFVPYVARSICGLK